MDFVIDTVGSTSVENVENISKKCTVVSELLKEYKKESSSTKNVSEKKKLKKEDDNIVKTFYKEMGWSDEKKRRKEKGSVLDEFNTSETSDIKQILIKSVITPDFEKKLIVPPFEISEKNLKKQRKKESELTKGKKWYGLPATEMTEEVKRDLEVLQMRSALDPKRFYKKNDVKVLPKYFQIGKIMDTPLDYYNNRLTKKERKKTLVDELLANAEFTSYNKRKYKEIIQEKQKTHYKAWKQAKKLKKNK